MSKSYRKPYWVCSHRYNTKWWKRQATKVVRHYSLEDLSNGTEYKKLYCSWDLREYSIYVSKYKNFEDYKKATRK